MNQKSSEQAHWGGASRFKLAFIALSLVLFASLAVFATNVFANAQDDAGAQASDAEVAAKTTQRQEMYRIYNPWTGEHLYTSDVSERDSNVKLGWRDEGIEWIAPLKSDIIVYRLYNPYVEGGDHHYTTDKSEYDSLAKGGWKQEGVAWYGANEKDDGAVPLYRQYNPFAATGTHNYTKSKDEEANLVKAGWKAEGIGWYGFTSLYISIEKMTAKVSTVGTTYTGKQLTPAITISGLTAGTDFTVTYSTNINAGKNAGTATIKGKGAYTGTLTVKFDIQKANPTFTAPTNLTGIQSDALSTVKIPAATNGTFSWKSPATTLATQGPHDFDAIFTPKDTNNYNTMATRISVYVKGLYAVTFNTNGGSSIDAQEVVEGEKAVKPATDPTLDKKMFAGWYSDQACTTEFNFDSPITKATTIYAKWAFYAEFDNQNHGKKPANKPAGADGTVQAPSASEIGTQTGLELEGWYTDAKCSGEAFDFNQVLTESVTLYANWVPAEGGDLDKFWIASSVSMTTSNDSVNVANENYVQDAWNVKKSSTEVQKDVATLIKGEEDPDYAAVKAEYDGFMNNDDYHLYTVYGDTSGKDGFAEFRIIEVGADHADGSILTFQATHLLPDAANIYPEYYTNSQGWAGSDLRTAMNGENGTIISKFKDGFISSILPVEKKANTKASGSWSIGVSTDTLWLMSDIEFKENTVAEYQEGSPYQYFKNLNISTAALSNNALARTTRSGNGADTGSSTTKEWWTRTARTSSTNMFEKIPENGSMNHTSVVSEYLGIVPCFCLGGNIVDFDNQGHGNEVDAQVISGDNPTASDPTEAAGTVAGLELEGWYKDAKCSEDQKWDFADEVSEPMTLYANWVPAEDGDALKYWISPAMKCTTDNTADKVDVPNENYVKEKWNVKKSSAEIQADVVKIQAGDQAVINEYKAYMTNDNYHLYTAWNGATNHHEEDSSVEHEVNKFVEFRILEVGSHRNFSADATTEDGSALTFEATHEVGKEIANPGTGEMGSMKGSTVGGWGASYLFRSMNTGSTPYTIFGSFNTGFTNDLMSVAKSSTLQQNSSSIYYASSKLWVLSIPEITNRVSYPDGNNAYSFYKNMNTTFQEKNNPALKREMRDGGDTDGNAWTRSADANWTAAVGYWRLAYGASGYLESVRSSYTSSQVVPAFCFGGGNTVTFDTNGHGTAPASQVAQTGAYVSDPTSQVAAVEGLRIEGWYTDAACTNRWDFNKSYVTKPITLYANWVADGDAENFWIAPSSKITNSASAPADNKNYVKENWNVKKSSKEILDDVQKINDGDEAVIAEYETLMKDDAYHLYTPWTGATKDYSGGDQAANAFVEFRIIHVGEHDEDDTSLTFQATHMLPTAQAMLTSSKSDWNWGVSELHSALIKTGDLGKCFKDGFKSHVLDQVPKKGTDGAGKSTVSDYVSDFWLASRSEISGSTEAGYKDEGTIYDYYADKNISDAGSGTNACLAKTTRAGNQAYSAVAASIWLLRSPDLSNASNCLTVSATGCVAQGLNATYAYGIVPCFCFGVVVD